MKRSSVTTQLRSSAITPSGTPLGTPSGTPSGTTPRASPRASPLSSASSGTCSVPSATQAPPIFASGIKRANRPPLKLVTSMPIPDAGGHVSTLSARNHMSAGDLRGPSPEETTDNNGLTTVDTQRSIVATSSRGSPTQSASAGVGGGGGGGGGGGSVVSGVVAEASQQQMNASSTSWVTSSSQRVHHVSTSEMKATSMKSDLTELKSSISEMKNLSTASAMSTLHSRLRSSIEELDRPDPDEENEPVITFPDPDTPPPPGTAPPSAAVSITTATPNGLSAVTSPLSVHVNGLGLSHGSSASSTKKAEMKYEQKRVTSASTTKLVTDSFSSEQATANTAEVKRLQAGEVTFKEATGMQAMRQRLGMEGLAAEKSVAITQEQRSITSGELSRQQTQSSVKMTEAFSSEKKAIVAKQKVVTTGMYNQENHMSSSSTSSHSNLTITTKGRANTLVSNALQFPRRMSIQDEDQIFSNLEQLEKLSHNSSQHDVDLACQKYSSQLEQAFEVMKSRSGSPQDPKLLNRINEMMRMAWAVPTHGHELGYTLCNTLRKCGGLELLITNCTVNDEDLQFASARLLEQCLTTENRAHVVENGLEKVVNVACVCTKIAIADSSRVGTGILEHLFKHSEGTCSDVIRLGGLDAVLFECRKNDVETLRHCAGALANLSLYGGAENQEAMIKRKVPMWLFPLAFHNDDNIKYYACLAIAVLVANTEIEAAVLQSGTLDLVEPFVTSHNPAEFARSNLAHAHGQSKNWLQRLVPVLSSKREEARNLAAFHFCMEAGIKHQQNNTEIFREIGAIEPLKKCASCPNAVASKYAAQALRLIGEEVPHKLSQQVPLWSTEDVREWVRQIGFAEYANNFDHSRVDGDLLLQLTEANLRDDIGISNGIRRRRFIRELSNLKKMADYSSKDAGNLNSFLQSMALEFSIYTYSMLNAGVDKDLIRCLSEEQLVNECGITNSIHRLRILESIRIMQSCPDNSFQESLDKPLDVFVSYRRSNGSQLASLLKVHLQLRGFSVFIDVERLEAGKFDNNLLQSIRQARHFLLVLTPNALERCLGDSKCKDWVHREIVAALQSQCNIIPITDNFQWPEAEQLPEDMRAVCHFNGVRWIHDYQDACVDKLERFMRGELSTKADGSVATSRGILNNKGDVTPSTPSGATLNRHPPPYQRMHSNDSSKGSDKDTNGSTTSRE